MLRKLYQRMMIWAAHRHARYWLMGVSASESVFFPIPPEVMLLPMSLAKPRKALLFAVYCTIGSVIGAAVGYAIGYWFFDSIGQTLLGIFDRQNRFTEIQGRLNAQDWLVIFLAAITPIPFKVATLGAGFLNMNLWTVLLAALIGRGLRYGIIAGLITLFGAKIQYFIENYFNIVVSVGCVALVAGWWVLF